jgi:23S rRNA (guanosine2251-2'-O)-methyltransferase
MKPSPPGRGPSGRRHAPHRPRTSGRGPKSFAQDRDDDVVRIYGLHAVAAALANPQRIVNRLLLTENAEHRLKEAVVDRGLEPERVTPRDLDRLLGPDTVHQGALAECEPLPEPDLAELLQRDEAGPIVVLDQVTDPHNVGAVLRSCAAFSASALVMTRRHSPPLDGTLAKSASGALEVVPIVLAQNLARALAEIKDHGYSVIGLADSANAELEEEPFTGRVAIVLGAEGKGLRELTKETCDRLVRITTGGAIESLNVSNAAAVTLHFAAWRRRTHAKT